MYNFKFLNKEISIHKFTKLVKTIIINQNEIGNLKLT